MAARHFKQDSATAPEVVDEKANPSGGAPEPLETLASTPEGPFAADPSPEGGRTYYTPGEKKVRRELRRGQSRTHSHHHRHHHHHRSHSHRKKMPVAVGVIAVLLFLVLCGCAAVMAHFNNKISVGAEATELKKTLVSEDATQNDGFYVLLVGSDAREGDTVSRGDVIMLCRIDPVKRLVTLVSIPRDTMVNIPGAVGVQKINAGYAYGGASSQVYTVSKFAGVPISHYVEIDFEGTKRLIDMLGGVWVNVPETVSNSHTSTGVLEAGRQLLNGETALAYARERHSASAGDFSRARAQRLIVQAIITQVMQASPLELPGLIENMASCVSTDYTVTSILTLAFQFRAGVTTVYSAATPSYAFWQDGVSYDGTMFDEWRDMMKRVDAGLDPNDTSVAIPEPQASSTELGKAENSEAPKDYHELAEQSLTTDAAGTDGAAEIEASSSETQDVTVVSDDSGEQSSE